MSFSVTATSLGSTLSYQWYFGSSAISGATSSTYHISDVQDNDGGSYSVVLINGGGQITAGPATLTVLNTAPVSHNDAYTITQNISRTVAAPGVLANDTDANDDDLTAILVSNVSHGTLTLRTAGGFTYLPATNYIGTDSFTYWANDNPANSGVATVTLTVVIPPAITNQPQSQIVPNHGVATFSVGASGWPNHYQWYFKNSTQKTWTNTTFTVTDATGGDAGNYFVKVTNIAGMVTSVVATLTIGTAPNVWTLGTSNVTNNAATLTGLVDNQNLTTYYAFAYGTTTSYGLVSATNTLPASTTNLPAVASVTGLLPGTLYHYCLAAINSGGATYGQDATFTTSFLPPAVSTTGASSVTTTTALLNANVNPQSSVTSYYFAYGLSTNYDTVIATNLLGAGSNNVAVALAAGGLSAGTVYHYSIVATNAGGTTMGADATFTTAYLAPVVTLTTATNITTNSAALGATINPQGTTASYYFEYGLTTAYDSVTVTNALPSGSNSVPVGVGIGGLTPGTVYHYNVVATSSGGTTTGIDLTFTTAYLTPVITTLGATNVTTNSAVLNASVNPQGTAASCYFQYGLTTNYDLVTATNTVNTGGVSMPMAGGANFQVVAAANGLVPGTVYHYCAVASSAGGTNVGADATFKTAYPPPLADTLVASEVTASSAKFRARLNPQGTAALYCFQYGTTTNFGSFSETNLLTARTNAATVSIPVSGLSSGTTYYYRAVAVSSGGMTLATNQVVATLTVPPIQFSGGMINQGSQWGRQMQLALSSVSGASFTVYSSTNPGLPLGSWLLLGSMSETASGQYQFTDPRPATDAVCFYRIVAQ